MKKRTHSTRYLFLVVAIERTETDESPSSSFPAAAAVNDKPGLTKSKATSGELFPWAKAVSK
jgi:hypothetical protein